MVKKDPNFVYLPDKVYISSQAELDKLHHSELKGDVIVSWYDYEIRPEDRSIGFNARTYKIVCLFIYQS